MNSIGAFSKETPLKKVSEQKLDHQRRLLRNRSLLSRLCLHQTLRLREHCHLCCPRSVKCMELCPLVPLSNTVVKILFFPAQAVVLRPHPHLPVKIESLRSGITVSSDHHSPSYTVVGFSHTNSNARTLMLQYALIRTKHCLSHLYITFNLFMPIMYLNDQLFFLELP